MKMQRTANPPTVPPTILFTVLDDSLAGDVVVAGVTDEMVCCTDVHRADPGWPFSYMLAKEAITRTTRAYSVCWKNESGSIARFGCTVPEG